MKAAYLLRGKSATLRQSISLTSVVGKVMESLVRDHSVHHMTENSLFCDAQHGFVPRRSFMIQLLVVIELWTEMLGNDSPVGVIYLDFLKAFDIVPHERLLEKLKSYGIDSTVGSVLGHILFVRYINDLPDMISSTAHIQLHLVLSQTIMGCLPSQTISMIQAAVESLLTRRIRHCR